MKGSPSISVLVTGCAGFIGSHLAQACLDRGDRVVGVDAFTDHYEITIKHQRIGRLSGSKRFEFHQRDVADIDDRWIADADIVFHFAGQPGVRASWRSRFDRYVHDNVLATQRLLEAAHRTGLARLVYASSSSVYGNAATYPVDETAATQPFSPYGVTKLAAEHLCSLYAANFGLSVISLRHFTVFGPDQRPDMAIHRLIEAARNGGRFQLLGSGEQVRDFTYIDDVVRANLLAGEADVKPGLVANVAGGGQTSINDLVAMVEDAVGKPVNVERAPSAAGDVMRTGGSAIVARDQLDWQPSVDLEDGIARQVAATSYPGSTDNDMSGSHVPNTGMVP